MKVEYKVRVARVVQQEQDVWIDAETPEQAEKLALEYARVNGTYDFWEDANVEGMFTLGPPEEVPW